MSDPLIKNNGAQAAGILSLEEDGRWRSSIRIYNLEEDVQKQFGPEFFPSEVTGRHWIETIATSHGFPEGTIDIDVERDE